MGCCWTVSAVDRPADTSEEMGAGEPKGQRRVTMVVRLDPRVHRWVKREAAARGQSMAAYVEATLARRIASLRVGKRPSDVMRGDD
jgi:predicted HicB family RNase H-like nuclease